MGGVGWGCRGKLALGFKPRSSSHREDHAVLGEKRRERGPRGFGREEKGERTMRFWERREGRENHAAFAEWGPHGGNTADGAGSLNHGLLLLLRYGTLDWAEGEGRTVCICGYSRGL